MGGGSVRGRVPVGVPLRWVCVCCVGGTWLRSLLLCFFECRVPRQNTDSPPLVEAMCEHSSRAFDPVATLAVRTLVVPPSPCARARNMAHTCATRPRAAEQPAWPHTCSLPPTLVAWRGRFAAPPWRGECPHVHSGRGGSSLGRADKHRDSRGPCAGGRGEASASCTGHGRARSWCLEAALSCGGERWSKRRYVEKQKAGLPTAAHRHFMPSVCRPFHQPSVQLSATH